MTHRLGTKLKNFAEGSIELIFTAYVLVWLVNGWLYLVTKVLCTCLLFGKLSTPRAPYHFLGGVLPAYFNSEWSFAQFRVPEYRSVCAFGADPFTLVILTADGGYYKAKFDPVLGGEMTRVDFARFDSAPASVSP